MENAGTWNSDLAFLIFGAFLLPIGLYFLGEFFKSIGTVSAAPKQAETGPKTYQRYQPRPNKPMSVNISLNLPNFRGYSPSIAKEKVKKAPVKATTQKKNNPPVEPVAAPKPEKPLTDTAIQSEAIIGLSNLGFKKSEASKIVKDVCSKNKYDSTESLIKACFVCIP